MRCYNTKCLISFPLKPEPLPVSCWLLASTAALCSCQSVNLILLTDPPPSPALRKTSYIAHGALLSKLSLPSSQRRQDKSTAQSQVPPPSRGNHRLCDTGGARSFKSSSVPNTTMAQPSRTAMWSCLIPVFPV